MLIRLCSVFVLVCLKCISSEAQATDFVDPDMLHFSNQGRYSQTDEASLKYCQNELAECKNQMVSKTGSDGQRNSDDIILYQMKNIVTNWMFVSGFQNFYLPPGDKRSVLLTLTLGDTDLAFVNKFLNDPSYGNFVNTVPILNRLFTMKKVRESYNTNNVKSPKEDWVKIMFNIIMSCFNKEFLLVSSAFIMGIFLLRAFIFGTELKVIVVFFVISVFFSGFLWNWCYMYQKAVVDQTVKRLKYEKYGSRCQFDSSFFGFIKYLFGYEASIDECTEYFRATEIDPIILVSPTLALSETLSMFIIHPSILMAEAMQKITKILFGNMIYGSFFGTPIVMIVFGAIFLFLFITISGQRVKLKLAYIGSIEIGGFQFYSHPPPLMQNEITTQNVPASITQSSQASISSSQKENVQHSTTSVNSITDSFETSSTSENQTNKVFSAAVCSNVRESRRSAGTKVPSCQQPVFCTSLPQHVSSSCQPGNLSSSCQPGTSWCQTQLVQAVCSNVRESSRSAGTKVPSYCCQQPVFCTSLPQHVSSSCQPGTSWCQTQLRSNKSSPFSWLKELGDMRLIKPEKRKPLQDFNSQSSRRTVESENISDDDVLMIRYRQRHRKMSF